MTGYPQAEREVMALEFLFTFHELIWVPISAAKAFEGNIRIRVF